MDIMLSVVIFAYNHEKYIEKCIDSILQQKTDFAFEILLADDCSKDNTVNLVKEKYGDKIRILNRSQNLGLCRNMYEAFMEAEGKYIVECSGDDYLLTDHVFQSHVDFLEKHPEYFSVFNYMKIVNVNTQTEKVIEFPFEDFTLLDFLQGRRANLYIGTMRNSFREDNPEYLCHGGRNNEEIQMYYYTLSKGKKRILPEPLFVYCFRTDAQNYCSTHSYLDMLEDYARGFRAVEEVDRGKHNLNIAKLWYYERNIDRILEQKDLKLILGIFSVLKIKEIIGFIWIKLLMRFNHRQIPNFLIRENKLIK